MTDLDSILRQPVGPSRTAALAAWFQGLYPAGAPVPILVGGAAVELYTGGGYTTGDLDFVGTVPSTVDSLLHGNGFERRGRHWVHEAGQLFFELPGRQLEPPSEPVRLEVGTSSLLAIGPEALLADRLAAWKHWRSVIDAANALLLLQALGPRLQSRLAARLARTLAVDDERRRLVRFSRRLDGRRATVDELRRWTEHS